MLELLVRYDGTTRIELRVGETTVGRSSSCHLVIPHPTVSRQHATFHYDGQTCIVRDLGSRSGTLVNGRIAKESPIAAGDVVTVGDVQIAVVTPDAATFRPEEETGTFVVGDFATREHDQDEVLAELARRQAPDGEGADPVQPIRDPADGRRDRQDPDGSS
jgi:pSer/pThr/pTyr-binding forkhead associated (FHA) protein